MSLISQAIQWQDNERYTPSRGGILCTTDFRPTEAKVQLLKVSRSYIGPIMELNLPMNLKTKSWLYTP